MAGQITQVRNGKADRVKAFSLIVQVGLAMALPLVGWLASTVTDNTHRLTQIEASRFTARDGAEIWKELVQAQARIPPWLEQRIVKIESSLSRIEERLNSGKDK